MGLSRPGVTCLPGLLTCSHLSPEAGAWRAFRPPRATEEGGGVILDMKATVSF